MMCNSKITFLLVTIDKRGRRSLVEVNGIGIQEGTAAASYSDDSDMSDYLAEFKWQANTDIEDKETSFKINEVKLSQLNGEGDETPVLAEDDSVFEEDISKLTEETIKNKFKGKKVCVFTRKAKENSLLKRLSSSSCTKSGTTGSVTIDGTDEEFDEIYNLKTNDGNNAECHLKSDKGKEDATLECSVSNAKKNFYFANEIEDPIGNSNYLLKFQNASIPSALCYSYETYSDNGVSGGKKYSSGGGLSGGAVAGIIIACVPFVIFAFSKGAGLIGGGAAVSGSSCANAPTSNEIVPKFKH